MYLWLYSVPESSRFHVLRWDRLLEDLADHPERDQVLDDLAIIDEEVKRVMAAQARYRAEARAGKVANA